MTIFCVFTSSPFTKRSIYTPDATSMALLTLPLMVSLLRMWPIMSTTCSVPLPVMMMLPLLMNANVSLSPSVSPQLENTSLNRDS